MRPKVLKYGDRGVDVKLIRGPKSWGGQEPGANTVFWSPEKWRKSTREGYPDEPAGGYNSFVVVDDPQYGSWKTTEGQRVALISINGIGEIRWRVEVFSEHYGEGAVQHFELKPWKEDK